MDSVDNKSICKDYDNGLFESEKKVRKNVKHLLVAASQILEFGVFALTENKKV